MKKTKIVCTLGPSSNNEKVLEKMLKNGMDVARFNFSHGTHEEHAQSIERFRRVRDHLGVPSAVMLDTKGPEIRVGLLEGGSMELKQGETVTLTVKDGVVGKNGIIPVSYKGLPDVLPDGSRILMDDGKIELKSVKHDGEDIICTVLFGGSLKTHKSINLPNVKLDMPYLSETDKSDLIFGIEQDVDFVAASFVRRREDVIELRKFIHYHGGHGIRIISKIENYEGMENFDDILEESDGIMVARGDMGVEIDFQKLPGLQKQFIKKCYRAGKMVITATQMLESMITNDTPTRAEISDVANAVFDGTSAVMLSGETAMGAHPERVVEVMSNIIQQAEYDASVLKLFTEVGHHNDEKDVTNAICDAACTTASDLKAAAIIAVTETGLTARSVSKFRPDQIIIAATPFTKTYHQLSLSWGVLPVMAMHQTDSDALFMHAVDCAIHTDTVKKGDKVVITAGVPLNVTGSTNTLKVAKV